MLIKLLIGKITTINYHFYHTQNNYMTFKIYNIFLINVFLLSEKLGEHFGLIEKMSEKFGLRKKVKCNVWIKEKVW